MARDLLIYSCWSCQDGFETFRPAYKCPNCGSQDIELTTTVLDDHDDFSGR